ncbi:MAG: Trypsin [Pseudomonadota bacterium]|jgi:hypothetical protein
MYKSFVMGLAFVFLGGCKRLGETFSSVQITNGSVAEARIVAQGVVRIRSVFNGTSGRVMSSCSGTLIHTPNQKLNACVVLSAAHCFNEMPAGAQHTVEFLSQQGSVAFSAAPTAVFVHPSFRSAGNRVTASMSAVDVSLVKFSCSGLSGVRPSRILAYGNVPVGANLIVAGFGLTTSEVQAEINREQGLSSNTQARMSKVLMQTEMRLRRVDFPPDSVSLSDARAGVFNLAGVGGRSSCNGDSGGPVFYDQGGALFLVGSTSAGPAQCERSTAVTTISSPLIGWMNNALGANVIQLTNGAAAPPEPVGTPPAQADEPPSAIPPADASATPEGDVAGRCSGVQLKVRAVSRPWGTIIKLIDKDSSQVADATQKCNLPNDSTVCVNRQPVPTGTGHSAANLSAPVTADGCEKFIQGRKVFLFMPDFASGN